MTTKTNVHAIKERVTLSDHLIDCEARYQSLVARFDSVDQRLDKLEDLISEIKQLLKR